jgi:MerR family mercuric resistance operon transcriptional regulator
MTARSFTIGKLADQAGVNIETVRYYERRGLLSEPPRAQSGYRLYDEDSLIHLRFIKDAQTLGFTLDEIGELLTLRSDAEKPCPEMRQRAERKIEEIEAKIRALCKIQATLTEMLDACEGDATGCCLLLAAWGTSPMGLNTEDKPEDEND